MERRNKASTRKSKISIFVAMIVSVLLILPVLVYSLSFSPDPSINNGATVYTFNDLVCTWGYSSDVTGVNVTWYNGSNVYSSSSGLSTSSTIDHQYTKKNDVWICQVLLDNGTGIKMKNATVNINNSAPLIPNLIYQGGLINAGFNLVEDTDYEFTINSSDYDLDPLQYSVGLNSLCSLNLSNIYTGLMQCKVTHEILTGTTQPAPESLQNFTVYSIMARENISPAQAGILDFNFTLIPVNSQAYFTANITNKSIAAGTEWSVLVNGIDEEMDYPLNFTFWSNLNVAFPGLLIINRTNSTAANISFSALTNNNDVGNWTVIVNVSDANGTNASRDFSQMTFALQINTSFYPPNFTTNFTALSQQIWIQGGNMTVWLTANSSNIGDNLSFSITAPTDTSLRCNISSLSNQIFPWNITTLITNNTNASGLINVSLLTNDFVACRYVDLTIDSQYGGPTTIPNYLFNITNLNDPPVLHEIGLDGNISNQSTHLYSKFTYRVNATDSDSITYDANRTANLTYYSNNSMFPINMTSGIIDFRPSNNSYVGTWNVNITVSDGYANDSKNMMIIILNNSVPVLNLSTNNMTFYQNDIIKINFSVTEPDNDTINLTFSSLTATDADRSFADSIYATAFTNLSNDYSGGVNLEQWVLDLYNSDARLRNNLVGRHRINITVTDSSGAFIENVSTGISNFTILNENDPPFFDNDQDNFSEAINLTDVVVNIPYSILINATDYDLFIGDWANESLSFNFSQASAGIDNNSISFIKVNNSTNSAELKFTATAEGTQSINLTVIDSQGANDSKIVTFTVESNSSEPIFLSIKPYFNTTLNYTVMNYTSTSSYTNNTNTINVSENTTVLFDALITNDTAIDNNFLTLSWYVDGVLNKTLFNATPGLNTNLSHYFNFFSNGTRNITLFAVDVRHSNKMWTWIVNVSNVNRPPVYCSGRLYNLTVNGTLRVDNYIGYSAGKPVFYDPDDDVNNTGEGNQINCSTQHQENMTLNFSVIPFTACSIASIYFTNKDLNVVPTLTGLCKIKINATDKYGSSAVSTNADVVDVNIIGATPSSGNENPSRSSGGSSTVTQVITVPVDQEVDKPVPIKIIAPGVVTTYANKTISIPILIKNTWKTDIRGVELSGVSLNASLAHESNVSIKFSQAYFGMLTLGSEVNVTLEITNYRTNGPFEITIYAKVTDPDFTDSTNILISSLEQTARGDEIKSKVTFAKDMLSDNPTCRELNDLIDRSEQSLNDGNLDDAARLIDGAINGCKYLMENEQARRETPSILQRALDLSREYAFEIMIISAIILLLTLVAYAIVALRKKLSEK